MKTRSSSVLVLLAVLGAALASPLGAAPAPSTRALAYPVGSVERDGILVARPGDSASRVEAYLGSPDQKLSGDTWVYRRFQCQPELENAEECTTLIISFSHLRVSVLQRVNESAVQVLAAQLTTPAAKRQLVAGK